MNNQEHSYKEHLSVLLEEVVDFFTPLSQERIHFADLTFGAGGHSLALLERFPSSSVVAVDQDPDALKNGHQLIKQEGLEKRLRLLDMNFSEFPAWFAEQEAAPLFHGILMDLGVSSHHFDSEERGFSFRFDAPLDMRMNPRSQGLNAKDIVNDWPEQELADLIFQYGEERLSRRIAREIVALRKVQKIHSTKQLENLIFHCYPKAQRHTKIHPATRTFQALRIAVNAELEVLEQSVVKLFKMLKKGGKLAIISFHSLEDRIVKQQFKGIVEVQGKQAARILTKKPIQASEKESLSNPRARSAKLRVIEKLS